MFYKRKKNKKQSTYSCKKKNKYIKLSLDQSDSIKSEDAYIIQANEKIYHTYI